MRKLKVFNFITLNGFFKDENSAIEFHHHGSEESTFSVEMLKLENILLFGRITYEQMFSYWTSEKVQKSDKIVADYMNAAQKIVFSNKIKTAQWTNTEVIGEDIVNQIAALKKQAGPDLTILGSGSIVTHFASHGLIDEFQIMLDPVLIGRGTPFASGLTHKCELTLVSAQTFKSGSVLLRYKS